MGCHAFLDHGRTRFSNGALANLVHVHAEINDARLATTPARRMRAPNLQ